MNNLTPFQEFQIIRYGDFLPEPYEENLPEEETHDEFDENDFYTEAEF